VDHPSTGLDSRPGVSPRGGLGRGLGAILPAAPVEDEQDQAAAGPVGSSYREIPRGEIRPNARQPRTVFDADALAELVVSLQTVGMLQPVVVRPLDPPEDGARYELVMGERRWRASGEAGMTHVPAIVRHTGDEYMLRDALLENLHRAQLNPLEEAAAYAQLLEEFGVTHEQLAARIGRSRSQVTNTVRLLGLPPHVQRRVAAGVLSAGHARALLAVADPLEQDALATRIVAEGLSVRAVEELVALGRDPQRPARRPRARPEPDPGGAAVGGGVADRLDTRVHVEVGKGRSRLVVEAADLDDLARIVDLIAGGTEPAAS
jgi:ParB family chromosome partitioning protein